MINTKIEKLREELNDLIAKGANFEKIQEVSSRLDQCLIEYYEQQIEKE